MDEKDIVKALAALAQPLRLAAFRYLVVTGPEGVTPSELSESLEVAPNTLSFHLKELTHAGLITQERVGRNLLYRADFEKMNSVLSFLTANCCRGTECLDSAGKKVVCC